MEFHLHICTVYNLHQDTLVPLSLDLYSVSLALVHE